MKKTIITTILLLTIQVAFAQVTSQRDNGEYAAKIKIAEKAKQLNLGTIHSESPEARPTAGKGGWFLRYEKGWVYYNPKTQNAQALWGDFMTKWATQNYEAGWLGFPVSDIRKTPNRTGLFVHFENGSIYQSPTTGTHFVGGLFREYLSKKGWENSPELGFPKTDEVEIFINGYTRYQQFEKGTLFWGVNKQVLYSNNPNATSPPNEKNKNLNFVINKFYSAESDLGVQVYCQIYGWMDVKVFKANGQEIADIDGRSFSIFNINIADANNSNAILHDKIKKAPEYARNYMLSESDLKGAYIRITYWLNDRDAGSADDYLKLNNSNGSWRYNNGNHPYREIKLIDIIKRNNVYENWDKLSDGSEQAVIDYKFLLN